MRPRSTCSSVMNTCTVARKFSGCCARPSAIFARRLFSREVLETAFARDHQRHLAQREEAVEQREQDDQRNLQQHPDPLPAGSRQSVAIGPTGNRSRGQRAGARDGRRQRVPVTLASPQSAANDAPAAPHRKVPPTANPMFSLQTMFGKGDKFYGLLEASADAARQSHARADRAPECAGLDALAGRVPPRAPARERTIRADRASARRYVRDRARPRGHRGARRGAVQDSEDGREVRRALCAFFRPARRRRFRLARGDAGESRRRDRADDRAAAQRLHVSMSCAISTSACSRSRAKPTG